MTVGEVTALAKEICGSAYAQWNGGCDIVHTLFGVEIKRLRSENATLKVLVEALAAVIEKKDSALKRVEGRYCQEAADRSYLNRDQHDSQCYIREALSVTPSDALAIVQQIEARGMRKAVEILKKNPVEMNASTMQWWRDASRHYQNLIEKEASRLEGQEG